MGGVWTADECLGDAHALCGELIRCAERDGATVEFDAEVESFEVTGNRVQAIRTSGGEVRGADGFVLAAGSHVPALARQLGIALPIYPIKGYSLTLPLLDPALAPEVSVTDLGQKTVFARLNGHLRVAAMAEVVGHDLSIPPDRIERMLKSVQMLFPGACDLTQRNEWAGLRPATPTSVPIIGPTRLPNLFVNAGHGALGFTLAAGSAVRLVELLVDR